jgi:hypothetical protein
MDFSNPDLKELACLIYETLKNSGINVVLVGGPAFLFTAVIDTNLPTLILQPTKK